jgi:hypothetical protein
MYFLHIAPSTSNLPRELISPSSPHIGLDRVSGGDVGVAALVSPLLS